MTDNETPVLDVPNTEDILRAVMAFTDALKTMGVKGIAISMAIDVGQGRIATKDLHTGVDAREARFMARKLLAHLEDFLENEKRQRKKGNLQ